MPRLLFAFWLATLGSLTSVLGEDIAYEPFSGYIADRDLAAPDQNDPPAATGITSYSTGNIILTHDARAGSLSYGLLATEGGKLELDTGGVGLTASLDTTASGPFSAYLENGVIGKDGTTLYLSLLLQMNGYSSNQGQSYFSLNASGSERLRIGHLWGRDDFSIHNALASEPIDNNAHWVVVRIQFQSGNDQITGWWDPDLTGGEGQSSSLQFTRDVAFDELFFQGQNNAIYIDEIRFGTTWASVTPEIQTTYTVSAGSAGNGAVTIDDPKSAYQDGELLYIEAIPDAGYRFLRWDGDVPAGKENNDRLHLTVSGNTSLTAVFEPGVRQFFSVGDGPVDPSSSSLLNLRSLNETVAGESGFVYRDGADLKLGDGTPVRFWGVTASVPNGASLDDMTAFLAKRGVNLLRWHTSLYDNDAPNLGDVDASRLDDAHRLVASAKDQGIYTKLSFFFILGLRMQAEWNVDGYTQAWLDANPTEANEAPYGLQFFDQTFQDAYKNWLQVLLTTPNPHDDDQTPLGQETAVAILELQNEDNLFFWTFDPNRYPPEQQNKLFGLFYDDLVARYGSIAAAETAWGGSVSVSGDDPANNRMGLYGAWYMTRSFSGSSAQQARVADQIRFLAELQKAWYRDMVTYVSDTLNSPLATTASNWKTADDGNLLDGEFYTYQEADIIDKHHYFSPLISVEAQNTQVSGGDEFYAVPGVNNPRALPVVYKTVANHPAIISEATWVNPNPYKSEAALLIAAYGAQNGLDGFIWFAQDAIQWQDGDRRWEMATPMLAGTFPAAALLYRRGDVAEAAPVVQEYRTLDDIATRQGALFAEYRGFDSTRDDGSGFDTSGSGTLDPLAGLAGPVTVAFANTPDVVAPQLTNLIDTDAKTVTSANGELSLFWGTPPGVSPPNADPPQGWFRMDTPNAQGFTGHLNDMGPASCSNLRVDMRNPFGSVVAVSLDGAPLASSRSILLQAATREWLRTSIESPVTLTENSTDYAGTRIDSLGEMPWQVEGVDATVTLISTGLIESIQSLDANGDWIVTQPLSDPTGTHQQFDLPDNALYTLVTLEPGQTRYQAWDAFTPVEHTQTSISSPSVDADADGWNNLWEYVLMTNPQDNQDSPALQMAGELFQISVRNNDDSLGLRYEVSTDLISWYDNTGGTDYLLVEDETEAGDRTTFQLRANPSELPDASSRSFFRLRLP